jgi:hypothetical protein
MLAAQQMPVQRSEWPAAMGRLDDSVARRRRVELDSGLVAAAQYTPFAACDRAV